MKRKNIDLLHELRMTVTQVAIPLMQLVQETRLINELRKANKAADRASDQQFQRELDVILRKGNQQNNNYYN